jgi:hypothetical protein
MKFMKFTNKMNFISFVQFEHATVHDFKSVSKYGFNGHREMSHMPIDIFVCLENAAL